MLRISQLKLPVEHTEAQLKKKLLKTAHIKEQDLKQFFIRKRSVDGRKKPELYYVYTVDLIVANEEHVKKISKGKLQTVQEKNYHIPEHGAKKLRKRPVVIGSGPAGLFCAYLLAFEGYEPLVIERGAPVRERQKVVEQFWKDGILNTASNVQFGEGGAGTFSDGKLNTLVKDKFGRNHFVLKEFVKHGAPEDILYEAKPHIGTDILKDVVASIRKEIESLGGEVHFRTKVCDILCEDIAGIKEDEAGKVHEQEITAGRQNSQIKGLLIEKDSVRTKYPCRNVIFAIGHSARDTFYMLHEKKLFMTPKAFAIGVRVEHPAYLINESQYGKEYPEELPTALEAGTLNGHGIAGLHAALEWLGEAGLSGIEEGAKLCPPTNRNLFTDPPVSGEGIVSLPGSLSEALSLAEKSEFIRSVLPEEPLRKFLVVKREECEAEKKWGDPLLYEDSVWFPVV